MVTQIKSEPVDIARDIAPAIAINAKEVDEQRKFPEASLEKIKQNGLMGLMIPREYGGMGASYETMSQVAQILSSACLSTGMIWAMHCQQVATIVDHASEAFKRKVLPAIVKENMFIASVTSEREKGGHLLTAYAPLLNDGEDVFLTRDAPVVTGGAYGDGYLITMRADEQSSPSDVVLVFAARSQLEIEARSGWASLGVCGTDSVALMLKGRLPKDQIINPIGGFERIAVTTMIPVGHIAWVSSWLGAAQGALQQMLDLLRNPKTRQGYNLQSELFTTRLARIRLQIDMVKAYLQQAMQEYVALREQRSSDGVISVPARFNIHINNLKILASELLFEAINQLVQLSGLRYGYLKNNQVTLERTFRDLRSASLMYANDRLLLANGKLALLDREFVAV